MIRISNSIEDPKLPKGQRAELADYKGSKLDRGHQAPAGDFNDQALKDQSFFLSNMVPQSLSSQSGLHSKGGQPEGHHGVAGPRGHVAGDEIARGSEQVR